MTVPLGLVDRSERGKLAIGGDEARAALNGIVTNEVEGLPPGTGVLAAVLTPKGKMLGDVRILDRISSRAFITCPPLGCVSTNCGKTPSVAWVGRGLASTGRRAMASGRGSPSS